VWSDGCYTFALCLHDEPVPGEFALRFARSCGPPSSAGEDCPSHSSAAAAAGGQRTLASRASSPPPAPALSSVHPPRSSWDGASSTSVGHPLHQPSLSPSPAPSSSPSSSPVRIPSSPDSDSDAPSPANASNWRMPSWARSAALEQAARAQEVAVVAQAFALLASHAAGRVRG
jgi:hypothetical protein